MPYDDAVLDQQWLVTWQQQAITWINIDFSWVESCTKGNSTGNVHESDHYSEFLVIYTYKIKDPGAIKDTSAINYGN